MAETYTRHAVLISIAHLSASWSGVERQKKNYLCSRHDLMGETSSADGDGRGPPSAAAHAWPKRTVKGGRHAWSLDFSTYVLCLCHFWFYIRRIPTDYRKWEEENVDDLSELHLSHLFFSRKHKSLCVLFIESVTSMLCKQQGYPACFAVVDLVPMQNST
jgi:hypothetical protein